MENTKIRRDREIEINNQIEALWTLVLYLNSEERKYLMNKLEKIICELKALGR